MSESTTPLLSSSRMTISGYYPKSTTLDRPSHHKWRWYNNYTTIDFINDHVSESTRLLNLKSQKGYYGILLQHYDAIQAWIILTAVGVLCGILASVIELCSTWLWDIKHGYCNKNFAFTKAVCCLHQLNCPHWIVWDSLYLSSSAIGTLFAIISTILVIIFADTYKDRKGEDYTVYYSAGSGVAEIKTILGGFIIRGCLGLKTLVVKTIAIIFAISSGLVIGQQGPIVHISCCIGNVIARLFPKYENEGKRREILSAAASAGVSVAFGAPIGGVLFSLEEVSYYFPLKTLWRSFYCALVAAITLKVIDPFGSGKLVKFQITGNQQWHLFEIVPFALIGIIGGLYGSFFIYTARKIFIWERKFSNNIMYRIFKVIAVTLLTNMLTKSGDLSNPDLIAQFFTECTPENQSSFCKINHSSWDLILLLLSKSFFMIASFGLLLPAGIFIPSMVVGCIIGQLVSFLIIYLQTILEIPSFSAYKVLPSLYAMVGAAATISGATRMTISLIVILFELTGSLSFAIPLMISIVISKFVADALEHESIYEMLITYSRYPYLNHKQTQTVEVDLLTIMETQIETLIIDNEYTFEELNCKLENSLNINPGEDGGFPILRNDKILVGYIGYVSLLKSMDMAKDSDEYFEFRTIVFRAQVMDPDFDDGFNATDGRPFDFSSFMDYTPICISIKSQMAFVIQLFMKMGLKTVCVIEEGKFKGIVHKKRLLSFIKAASKQAL